MDWFKGLTDMVKPELLWMILPAIGVATYSAWLLRKALCERDTARNERDELLHAFEAFDPYDAPSEFRVLGIVLAKQTPAKIKVVLNKRFPERVLRSNAISEENFS